MILNYGTKRRSSELGQLRLDMEAPQNENCISRPNIPGDIRSTGQLRVGRYANQLRDCACLCDSCRIAAGKGAGSCRRNDGGAGAESKAVPCEGGLTPLF
jgi:hypothetical protein